MNKFALSDIGRHREVNQDDYLILEQNGLTLAVLCDGMGGQQGGSIACETCLRVMGEEFKNAHHLNSDLDAREWLYYATIKANEEILSLANNDPLLVGMGTTMVALLLSNSFKVFASVGDSRLYSYDKLKLKQLSEDQTFVAALLKAGFITEKEAKNHPRKNMLISAVGASLSDEIEIQIESISSNNNILICSDGLYNMLKDEEIHQILRRDEKIEDKGKKLIDAANEKGGYDNIGLILLENII